MRAEKHYLYLRGNYRENVLTAWAARPPAVVVADR
jgi:hypothetical protein